MTTRARLGDIGLVALVIGIVAFAAIVRGGPSLGAAPVATGPVSGHQASGPFELILTASKGNYRVDEPVNVEATLTYHGPDAQARIGHGLNAHDGPVGFGIVEPVGRFRLSPFTRTACTSSTLAKDEPVVIAFEKSGVSFGDNAPSSDELNAFFTDPILRLPAGTWHIYAIAEFSLGGCSANPTHLRAEVTVYVPASDGSIPTAPPPTPTTNPGDLPVGDDTQDGPIQLTLSSPHRTWKAGQPIEVTAGLGNWGPGGPITTYGSSSGGPVSFVLRQLDGPVSIGWGETSDCVKQVTLALNEPLGIPYRKTSNVTGATTDVAFWQSWLADPALRLPAGTWEITAMTDFSTSPGCGTPGPDLRPTMTILVTP